MVSRIQYKRYHCSVEAQLKEQQGSSGWLNRPKKGIGANHG
jgi:hypothetical protein